MITQPRTRKNPLLLVGRAFQSFLERISGANRWKTLGQRPTSCVRPGDFYCDPHWAAIEESQAGEDPIHATSVTLGLAAWLYITGVDPDQGPVNRACCIAPANIWDGILERSRTKFWAERTSQ